MFFRWLIAAACLLILISSASNASDVRVDSYPPAGRTSNSARMSSLTPEELMQAVRRDLDSAVQTHEALADSLRGNNPERGSTVSDPRSLSVKAASANDGVGWETRLSSSNPQLRAWESYFSGSAHLRAALLCLGSHRRHLEEVLKQNGLPPQLLAVAFVESDFVRNAVSPKGATGLWQFMPLTAVRYGLELKPFVDDRTDFEKSTVAAARYLTDLHERFGDWLLALAAYNAGEEEVESAIAKGKTRDFWELSRKGLLPDETENYVPKVLGALRTWEAMKAVTPMLDSRRDGLSDAPERKGWVYAAGPGI